eukprot:COSAG02_NODE_29502_length_568_cov_0.654584_2_plen_31_part_01
MQRIRDSPCDDLITCVGMLLVSFVAPGLASG